MKYKLLIIVFFFFSLANTKAQQQPERTGLRIADTLTKQERSNRNTVLLKSELDSMIQLHIAGLPPSTPTTVKEIVSEIPSWVTIAGITVLFIIAFLLYLLFNYHKRLTKTVSDLKRLIQNFEFYTSSTNGTNKPDRNVKSKTALEKKIQELTAELEKEKQAGLSVMQEYGLLKQSIAEVYKIRNYPLFDKEKGEDEVIADLLKTEKAVANHAFEKFLKPVIAIADANKNNPAKISKEESERLVELLVSLSLYHIEYLYLRINDLAVGGNIVQRIGSNGKGLDPALLKTLNIEHGSRALVLRMALDKAGIDKLSYPVFDETDLNNY